MVSLNYCIYLNFSPRSIVILMINTYYVALLDFTLRVIKIYIIHMDAAEFVEVKPYVNK